MEDFLKEKLSHGEDNFADDWPVFEQKLERALFFKQIRVGALVSVVLIMLSIGFFGGSSFSRFNIFQKGNNAQTESYRGDGKFSDFNAERKADHQKGAEERIALDADEGKTLEAEETIVPENVVAVQVSEVSEAPNKPLESQQDFGEKPSADNTNETHPEEQTSGGGENESMPVLANAENTETQKIVEHEAQNTTEEETAILTLAEENLYENAEPEIEPAENMAPAENLVAANTPKPNRAAGGGQALIPDGLETSNFKANVKPIELMVDTREINAPELRAPVIPMKLTPAKKEPYVSPLQEKNPWSYSIKVYPNFTYRKFTVAANKMPYIHRDFIDQVEVSESGGFSLNVGFEASKRIGRITYLNGGIEYISYKTEANFDFMNYRDAVINSESGKITSYDFRNEPEHIVIVDANRYHYLNFPLSIAYKPWATDHVRLNIEAGASYMYFISASGKSIDYQTLEIIDLSDRDYRNSMASVCLKVGASYHVSEQFSLGFEPTVVYFSNTIYTEEYPFEVVPYSVGVNFKLQMKLN